MKNIEKYHDAIKQKLQTTDVMNLYCTVNEIRTGCDDCPEGRNCRECCLKNLEWLNQEYKDLILDDEEKTYLREVIRPFRCYVKYISKEIAFIEDRFRIKIVVKQFVKQSYDGYCEEWISLPSFKGDMYKGMELRRNYTLEELGL